MAMINLSEIRVSDLSQKISGILPVTTKQKTTTDYPTTIIRCGVIAVAWAEIRI